MKQLQNQGLCEIIKNADPYAKSILGRRFTFYARRRKFQTEFQDR